MIKLKLTFFLFCSLFLLNINAQETEKIMLSGPDFEHQKEWDFKVTDGQNSGKWTKIGVPSQWETEGFGTYTYGRWYKELNKEEPSKEEGFYKYEFEVPQKYEDQQVIINFGGAMTDTEVKINGKLASEKHQGGFYEFSYDISDLINEDGKNLLEVHVWKHSENHNVNRAERYADWWLFGGIYRPVWLTILPKTNIKHVAIDAKADGNLTADLEFKNLTKNAEVEISLIADGASSSSFKKFTKELDKKTEKQRISVQFKNVNPWNPEDPNLYWVQFDLKKNGEVLHSIKKRIGFRTLEFKKRDGIYVNGTKIKMKGINRHTFWPESGRSTSKRISLMDVNLIKDMNMNAVRFHYPPDTHFLEVCDSLGLFVLDELAGWQNGYDTETGQKLVKEMVQRDVNHPSVIIWDQGNEGGWNYELDNDFAKYDPQNRIVIHPWADFNGWDAHHYPTYQTGVHRFGSGENVFFPTETMHGTYDNGIGSGLRDFWEHYSESPLFAGSFLWVFSDEAVLRTDWTGEQKYDSKGNLAPDGALGPHREKEGSFYAVKEVWAPMQFEPLQITQTFNGDFLVENTYLFTNLNECNITYKVQQAQTNFLYVNAEVQTIYKGDFEVSDIQPGETRKLKMPVKDNFFEGDWVEITATDKHGREIYTWTWKIHHADAFAAKFIQKDNGEKVSATENGNSVVLSGGNVSLTLDKKTGEITKITNAKGEMPFVNGPRPIGMQAEVDKIEIKNNKENAVATVFYNGGIDHIKWTITNDGRVHMAAIMLKNAGRNSGFDGAFFQGEISKFGLTFDFPEEIVEGFKWFGKGPYRVWKNRLDGVEYNVWDKDYNNTITGESFENLIYPEFKGYHANFIAGKLEAKDKTFRIFSESDQLFLRLFTPDSPKNIVSRAKAHPSFPEGNISFMYEIPGMHAFKPLSQQGPSSQPTNIRIKNGDDGISMKLWFDFRDFEE